ncbi:hypothetical protein IJ541_06000 [bacterium]|nr:hypothetical protein [bacterium]
MNYRLFLSILLILAFISTVCICMMKPQMHKSVLVYSSEFTIEPEQEAKTESVEVLPTVEQNSVYIPRTIKTFDVETSSQKTVVNYPQKPIYNQPVKEKNVTVTNQTNVTKPKTVTQNVALKSQTPQIDLNKIVANNKKIQETQKSLPIVNTAPIPNQTTSKIKDVQITTAPAPQKVTQAPQPIKSNTVTPQQEEIAWNIWRSNLQNKLMSDVALPNLPNGIVFKYSFTVDKYGKVTNVKTWSTDSKYTPYAIQYIAPVIRSYQGRSILNFPTGSSRITTVAQGAWKLSDTAKYSTPQDYNDIERISR